MNQMLPRVCKSKNYWVASEFFQRTARISTRVPRDFCLVVNYKQKTGAGIDLAKTFCLRHSGTFCCLIKIPCAKPQAVPHFHFVPKGSLWWGTLSKWAAYQSVRSIHEPSANCMNRRDRVKAEQRITVLLDFGLQSHPHNATLTPVWLRWCRSE